MQYPSNIGMEYSRLGSFEEIFMNSFKKMSAWQPFLEDHPLALGTYLQMWMFDY